MGGAATNQLIMGKRPVDVVDLTGTDVIIDLTIDSNECVGDTEPLRPVKSKIEIPWTSKLPKHDHSKKIKLVVAGMKNYPKFQPRFIFVPHRVGKKLIWIYVYF